MKSFNFDFDSPGPRIKFWGTQEVNAFFDEAKEVQKAFDDGPVSKLFDAHVFKISSQLLSPYKMY